MRRSLLSCALMVAAVLLPGALTADPAHAAFRGDNGLIAYTDLSDGQIYTVHADGSHRHRLTSSAALNVAPQWSADGKHITFARDNGRGNRIHVMDADGSNDHVVTGDHRGWNDVRSSFSPDGRQLVFSRCQTSNMPCALALVSVDGSGLHQITRFGSGADFAPEFSPDGQMIAFLCVDQGAYIGRVCLVRPDGSDRHGVTPPALEGTSPDWSPDGSLLVFNTHCCTANSALYSIRPDGSGLQRLTRPAYSHNDFDAAYSPDGQHLAFISDRRYSDSCCIDLFTSRSDGTGMQAIVTSGSILWPSWQPRAERAGRAGSGLA